MKKIILLGILIVGSNTSFAQTATLGNNEIIWFGLDFSEARFIGSNGFTDPDEVKDYYFDEWNDLIKREIDKYDLKEAYKKSYLEIDLNLVEKRNDLPNASSMVIENPYEFDEGKVEKIISQYNPDKFDSGLGLVYIVEYLSKTDETAAINVVFFDIASRKVLWSKLYKVKPGGFGFRNYWARAFYNTLNESGEDFVKDTK